MQKLLMLMYHLTPEQAAARVPVFQFWLTAFGAALLIWLDSKGSPSSRRACSMVWEHGSAVFSVIPR